MLTTEKLDNADLDVATIGDVATGSATLNGNGTTVDRNGVSLKTLARMQADAEASIAAFTATNNFDTVALLKADTSLNYTDDSVGDYVEVGHGKYRYSIAAAAATDYHLVTAGGVRLYVVADRAGFITTGQLGWSDSDDVTTDINRFWSRFNAGETFYIEHFVTVSSLFSGEELPENFTILAKKRWVDGFNWTLDVSDSSFGGGGMFAVPNDGASFIGLRLSCDQADGVSGQYIRSGGSTYKERLVIDDCLIEMSTEAAGVGGIDAPIYLQNVGQVKFLRSKMTGGKWLFVAVGVNDCEFAWNELTNGATDFGNATGECIKTIQNDTWGVCERWHVHNNYAHDLQRDFIDLTGGCRWWLVEHNHLKDIANGGGGIDIKTQHPSREDTWNPNRDMIIRDNIFENASVIIKHNYEGTWLTGGVFNGTDAEVDALDVRNILFTGNQWYGTGDLTNEGGRNVVVDGDHFYDSTNPFDWLDDVYDAFGNYVPSLRGMVIKNIVYHHDASRNSANMPALKNLSLHFAHLHFKNGAGSSGMQVRSGAEDWFISADKVTFEGTDTTNRMAFYVNQEVKNIHFYDINATHEGRGTEIPYFINIQGVDADSDGSNIDGDIHVYNCNVRGFRGVVRVAQTDIDRLSVRNNVALDCTEGLIILSGGANASDVGDLWVLNNIGDGTIPEVSGTLNSGTVHEGTANGNVNFT